MHPGPPDAPRDVSLGARAPRVLVVEDERLVAVDLKAVLHRVGYVMARRRRRDIQKRQDLFGLVHLGARDLAANNFTKKAIL